MSQQLVTETEIEVFLMDETRPYIEWTKRFNVNVEITIPGTDTFSEQVTVSGTAAEVAAWSAWFYSEDI